MLSFQEQLRLWESASLYVRDVRHVVLQPGECLGAHRLTDSMFLFTIRGRAKVMINETAYEANTYLVCHAGRGAVFDIVQAADGFEYTIVSYQALLPGTGQQELRDWQQGNTPFQMQYDFTPRHPLPLYQKMELMRREWQHHGSLEKFHVKALFHQFVYELLQQMQERGSVPEPPNLVAQAVRYIEEHYAEPISLHSLAALLDCNARQLQRLFHAKLGVGPMEYVMQVRLNQAKSILQQLDVPIAQVSEAVGYTDSYYFSRVFKKYTGMSPSQFKAQYLQTGERRQNPSKLSQSYIVSREALLYSDTVENGFHSHYRNEAAMLEYSGSTPASLANKEVKRAANGTGSGKTEGGMADSACSPVARRGGGWDPKRPPKKIVVLDYQYIDQLWALGQKPIASVIGTSDTAFFLQQVSKRLTDVKIVGTKERPDLQAIEALRPDLIICTQFHQNIYEKLAAMAPTLMLDRNEDWRSTLPILGEIVGKEQEARDVIDRYNEKVVHLKDVLAAKLGKQTVSLIRPRDNMIRLHTTSHRTAKILYRDLGIAAPAMAMDSQRTSSFLALDALPQLDADRLFVLQDDSNARLANEYQKTAIWKGLNAVKANRVSTVNTTVWIGYYGPIGNNLVVDQIANVLLQNPS